MKRPRKRGKRAPIDIVISSPRWKTQAGATAAVRKAVAAAAQATSTSRAGLAIVLTDDSAIRALNRHWRGFDTPTNVLSFPASPVPPAGRGRTAGGRQRSIAKDLDHHIGDVVIAFQTVAREAKAQDKPFRDHLTHLAVHGYLHLLGYDHETDADAERMERLEARILARLGVPDPYAAPADR